MCNIPEDITSKYLYVLVFKVIPSGCQTNILYAFISHPLRDSGLSNVAVLDFAIRLLLSEEEQVLMFHISVY
jgi:hypothetical protein